MLLTKAAAHIPDVASLVLKACHHGGQTKDYRHLFRLQEREKKNEQKKHCCVARTTASGAPRIWRWEGLKGQTPFFLCAPLSHTQTAAPPERLRVVIKRLALSGDEWHQNNNRDVSSKTISIDYCKPRLVSER